MDISTIGGEPESKVDTDSVRRTFEVHFLAYKALLAVKEKVSHLVDEAFKQLSSDEIAHFKSITRFDANGRITHWEQNGDQLKMTRAILSSL